jgi:hypothetical protein
MKKEWIDLDTNTIKPTILILMNCEEFKIQVRECRIYGHLVNRSVVGMSK